MRDDAPPTPTPRRARRWRGWLFNIVIVLVIFSGVQWWKAGPLATGTAPELAGVTLEGAPFDLAERRGQPVLVHFWASWCPMCKAMDGAVTAIARDHPVITVAMQSGDWPEVQRFMQETGEVFPVILDPSGDLATRWGVRVVPASFVVDANGRISAATVGVSTEIGLRLRLWLADQGGAG